MSVRSICAGLIGALAFATGSIAPACADQSGFNWSGLYVGGHVGGAWSNTSWDNISLTNERVSFSDSGYIGGGHVGLQHQFGAVVAGVEVSYSGLNLNDKTVSAVNPAVTYGTKIDNLFIAAGRVGIAADAWLFYVKGGFASARTQANGANAALDSFASSQRTNGYVAGGGVEWNIGKGLILGVEYDYVNLDGAESSGLTRAGLPYAVRGVDNDFHTVMGRLSYKFGREERRYEPMK